MSRVRCRCSEQGASPGQPGSGQTAVFRLTQHFSALSLPEHTFGSCLLVGSDLSLGGTPVTVLHRGFGPPTRYHSGEHGLHGWEGENVPFDSYLSTLFPVDYGSVEDEQDRPADVSS